MTAPIQRIEISFPKGTELRPGTCTVCGCQDRQACPDGCSWVEPLHVVCSACLDKAFDSVTAQKVREIIGKKDPPPLVLARDEDSGKIVQVVATANVDRILREKAKARGEKAETTSDARHAASQKREREKDKLRVEATKRVKALLNTKIEKACEQGEMPPKLLEIILRGAIQSTWHEAHVAALELRGLVEKDKKGGDRRRLSADETLEAQVDKLSYGQRAGLLVELLLARDEPRKHCDAGDIWAMALKQFRIDYGDVEKQILAEEKAKKAGNTAAAPVAKASTPKAKKRGGRR